ncbi:hypothetical protein [Pseudomonas baetica]|uniref:hypothetical protein n=1 Tax=Pseudomonas baetica TaxID=674054 RepID=UPI0024066C0B|nr:hypothetical protein [Pseudomonas baetica]MDF9778913.1 hypothetical protein [Pseudomonas baetica]
MSTIVDLVDLQFATGTLDVTPSNWAHLASAFSVRLNVLRDLTHTSELLDQANTTV